MHVYVQSLGKRKPAENRHSLKPEYDSDAIVGGGGGALSARRIDPSRRYKLFRGYSQFSKLLFTKRTFSVCLVSSLELVISPCVQTVRINVRGLTLICCRPPCSNAVRKAATLRAICSHAEATPLGELQTSHNLGKREREIKKANKQKVNEGLKGGGGKQKDTIV